MRYRHVYIRSQIVHQRQYAAPRRVFSECGGGVCIGKHVALAITLQFKRQFSASDERTKRPLSAPLRASPFCPLVSAQPHLLNELFLADADNGRKLIETGRCLKL